MGEKEIDEIQYSPYGRWYFVPKTTDNPFELAKEIIVSVIKPLLTKEPFNNKDVYFSIFRYGKRIELRVFASPNFLEDIRVIIESCQNPSIEIESGGDGSYFCTKTYCESKDQEMDARKFFKDVALICCDLYQNNLVEAVKIAVKYEFPSDILANSRPNITKNHPKELKEFFRENSPHYCSIENSGEIGKFWDGFRYSYNGSTPWNHWFYSTMVGLEYANLERNGISQQIKLSCPDYLGYVQLYEKELGCSIVHPGHHSCEEALAFHVNKLMGNY